MLRKAGYPNTLNGGGYNNEEQRLYLETKCPPVVPDSSLLKPYLSRGAQAAIVLVMLVLCLGGAAYYVVTWKDQAEVRTEIVVNRKQSLAFSSATEENMQFENPLNSNA